ncbi:hypothetical protein B0H13DRAFT_1850672 [Mycena leptocephala]|nr:hypothetical protein B0H13DRAFT_1850672 [Mycena leptocephala]
MTSKPPISMLIEKMVTVTGVTDLDPQELLKVIELFVPEADRDEIAVAETELVPLKQSINSDDLPYFNVLIWVPDQEDRLSRALEKGSGLRIFPQGPSQIGVNKRKSESCNLESSGIALSICLLPGGEKKKQPVTARIGRITYIRAWQRRIQHLLALWRGRRQQR